MYLCAKQAGNKRNHQKATNSIIFFFCVPTEVIIGCKKLVIFITKKILYKIKMHTNMKIMSITKNGVICFKGERYQ
jgi:hypothetical protein